MSEQVFVAGSVGAVSVAISDMNPDKTYQILIDGKATQITDENSLFAAGTEKPTEVSVVVNEIVDGKAVVLYQGTVVTEDARYLVDNVVTIQEKDANIASIGLSEEEKNDYEDVERKLAMSKKLGELDAKIKRVERDRKTLLNERSIIVGLLAKVSQVSVSK